MEMEVAISYVQDLVNRARAAQAVAEGFTQEQVDVLAKAMAKAIYDHAEELATLTVEETRMGVVQDKINKCLGKSRVIWTDVKGKKTVGIIKEMPELGLVEVAKPMGVVGAVTPTTNPVVTPMCNGMFAVKGRNAMIVCPHPRAKKCTTLACKYMSEYMQAAAKAAGFECPADLLICIEDPKVEISQQVMAQCDVCISTGGPGMVKAAYKSGKPAFGVGAGNVQCIYDRDIDLEEAVKKTIAGRIFDNGIICSGEQTAITPAEDYDKMVEYMVANGAYYVEKPEEVDAVRNAIFPFVDGKAGSMNKDLVGQSAMAVAEMAGIKVPEGTKVLLIKMDKYGAGEPLSSEKMCPAIAAWKYDTWEEAVAIAHANLLVQGAGHSVAIHSNNDEHIKYAANILPVSRFLINQICSTNNGGSFFNSLSATTTLGCGSWGGNSISENLSWKHLINVSRIAKVRPGATMPTDEEVWA